MFIVLLIELVKFFIAVEPFCLINLELFQKQEVKVLLSIKTLKGS